MSVALFAGLMIISVGINAFCVQIANRKAIGIEMSYRKSFLVVTLRTAAALFAGLAIGLLVSGYVSEGVISLGIVEIILTAAVMAMSFLVYKTLIYRFTGNKVSIVSLSKSIAWEFLILAMITVFGGMALALVLWTIGRFI